MALLSVTFRPAALGHDTTFNLILPDACGTPELPAADIPTVYLLHGMHGDHTGWCRKTSIERYAQDRRIAIVMPDGENGFYTDMKYGKRHFTYVADELPAYVRRIFSIGVTRERTFICGLSMGGYGAIRLALMRPEQYAACASLSGCLDLAETLKTASWMAEAAAIWGEDYRTQVKATDADLLHLLDTFPTDSPKPRIYAACGRQDSLFASNLTFADHIQNRGFDFRFTEADGIHNWLFWDTWIQPALDFMLN